MKIVRKTPSERTQHPRTPPWKLLVVDDEPDVRQLTALNLRGFEFSGAGLELIEAGSAAEAQEQLEAHSDIAVALIDVVMETDDAGLKLVEYIRNTCKNRMIRVIIRTGQPGIAPERFVIDNFDIDDYKDKTELTVQRLYTTVRTALKGYRDLQTIELNRAGLSQILHITPELYNLHQNRLEDYFRGVLLQIVGICRLAHSGMISSIDGLVATVEGRDLCVRASIGDLDKHEGCEIRRLEVAALCSRVVLEQETPDELRQSAIIIPLKIKNEILGFVYLESESDLNDADQELIRIMANQCAAALDNFRLHHSLEDSYDAAIDMLAQMAEFKDSATGAHIKRMQEYTRRIALAFGLGEETANNYAHASRLHDIGKVGIPDDLLRKPGPLTPDEFAIMQRHTLIGDTILARSGSLATAREMAKSHHERWDGSGYPQGLNGPAIPLPARIVAVADVFDALVNMRPYKKAWPAEEAIMTMISGRGSQFDPEIFDAFIGLYQAGRFDDLIAASVPDS